VAQTLLHACWQEHRHLQPFNDLCALMFFKGALLNDPKALLREQGESSRSSLRVEFRSAADVTGMKSALRDLVADAIRVEQAGLRVKQPAPLTRRDYPDELTALMEADPAFRDAFEPLTPRRQRGYPLQRRQAISDMRGPHRARAGSHHGRLRNARLSAAAIQTIVVVGRATRKLVDSRRQSRECCAHLCNHALDLVEPSPLEA
jgi:hypothetical protein